MAKLFSDTIKNNASEIIDEKVESTNSNIIKEYISKVSTGEIKAAKSIQYLIKAKEFESNLDILSKIFFENKLQQINSKNYNQILAFINSVHKIKEGNYNDFNIWSASKTHLETIDSELINRHNDLNSLVGFPDNGNGLYKSFLGKENLQKFIKLKFENDSVYPKRYWLYSPGENGDMWDEFYSQGIMGLGWDKLGDLNNYSSKEELTAKLQELEKTTGSKKNDSTANYEFKEIISIGDVIIAKKGRRELLGYGVVTSDYYYDNERSSYQKCRKIEWEKKGSWKTDHSLALKTLTDITKYPAEHPEYITYYDRIIGYMEESKYKQLKQMNFPLNTILYGPPGTGKTYNTILRAAEIIENRTIDSYQEALKIFKDNLHNRIEFITFHQNYSYEDFIQGLRPETDNKSALTFDKKDGVFKRIADKAKQNPYFIPIGTELKDYKVIKSNDDIIELWSEKTKSIRYVPTQLIKDLYEGIQSKKITLEDIKKRKDLDLPELINSKVEKYYFGIEGTLYNICEYLIENEKSYKPLNYVIIIDEINRANISRVFGELITLIEPDKRSHGEIPLEVKLPSGDPFIVPSNLYIIGTMNTADKSIALLDIALRRRFEFESMYPLYEIKGSEIYDKDILLKINEQIIKAKGHDFQIGHAYFMGENKDLTQRMNKKVIPLLLEYFMNDEKEVKGILFNAGLQVEENSWPLKIAGKRA